jgi:hypothetical protein
MWRYLTIFSAAAAIGTFAVPASAQNYGHENLSVQQNDQSNDNASQLGVGMDLDEQVPNDTNVYSSQNSDVNGEEQEANRALDRDYDQDELIDDQATRGMNDEDLALNNEQPDEGLIDQSHSGHDANSDDIEQ